MLLFLQIYTIKNGKAISVQAGIDRGGGFIEVKAPRFQDNRHMNVVRLSPTHRTPLPPGNIPGTHFC